MEVGENNFVGKKGQDAWACSNSEGRGPTAACDEATCIGGGEGRALPVLGDVGCKNETLDRPRAGGLPTPFRSPGVIVLERSPLGAAGAASDPARVGQVCV